MIIFDTETTNLVLPKVADLKNQPEIIDLFALKVDDETLEIQDELEMLIRPQKSISEEITNITGITNEMVADAPTFPRVAKQVAEFWFGQKTHVGHNISFDHDMLIIEFTRLGLQYKFPWPMNAVCTVELTEHYEGRRMKLIDLHKYLLGEGFEGAHRARSDVEATWRCLKAIKERGDLPAF